MPMNKSLYPKNWNAIARAIKERADWTCQECGKPCRKPGVEWNSFVTWLLECQERSWYDQHYEVVEDELGDVPVDKPQRFTLTVAHLDHDPSNCAESNLKALCAPCHLRYDAEHHARAASATRARKRAEATGQLSLLEVP